VSYIIQNFDDKIAKLLQNGGVGFMPTDTIYGLSCRALDQSAVKRLHQVKNRDSRPFIILISSINQLHELGLIAGDFGPALGYWPGKLSVIGKADRAPEYLHMGTKTLAVRQPDYPELLGLINKTGPLVSTSANLSGQEPAHSLADAQKIFGDKLDFYVDVGPIDAQPSTIVKTSFAKLKVIRQGEVKINEI